MRSADFNADGMTDLLITTSKGYYIYWNRNGSFSDEDRYYSTAFNKCDIIQLGDFNGDGLVDLIVNQSSSPLWCIAQNTGTDTDGFFSLKLIRDLECTGSGDKKDKLYCIVQDVDGDG